jgi:hypothetical protein
MATVMRGHSAWKTRVNALVTRASIFFVKMDCRVKPGNDMERMSLKQICQVSDAQDGNN